MAIEVVEEGVEALPAYAAVSIAFEVRSVFRPAPTEGGRALVEEPVTEPWVKDYDLLNPPLLWRERWNSADRGLLTAYEEGRRAGGAVVVGRSNDPVTPTEREDVLVLWDLRVRPERRGAGIGTALFERALAWGRERHYRRLKAETQNVNVPACRFYERRGCTLQEVVPGAYRALPDEVMLIYGRDLSPE